MRSPHPKQSSAARRGFTLTEMLVVVGIIVLIVTLAVPAMNAITGNRSIDSAQNQLAAIIGRARQEAIGLQDFRGVLIFMDGNTGRPCATEVYYPNPPTNAADPNALAPAPAHDELLLPTGISFRMVENAGTASIYYSPMNVIMFNNRGEFVNQPWTINPVSTLGQRVSQGIGSQTLPTLPNGMPKTRSETASGAAGDWTTPNADQNPTPGGPSAFGFILFPDEGAYQNAYTNNASTTYLTDTGITFLINKYNGTLLRSE